MPIWLKVLLVTAVLVVAGGVAFKFWFDANRVRLQAVAQRAHDEGIALGRNSDAEGCVVAGLARLRAKGRLMERAADRFFLKACLTVAARPAGFCDGVPKPDEPLRSVKWAFSECERRHFGQSQLCPSLMEAVREACWSKAK